MQPSCSYSRDALLLHPRPSVLLTEVGPKDQERVRLVGGSGYGSMTALRRGRWMTEARCRRWGGNWTYGRVGWSGEIQTVSVCRIRRQSVRQMPRGGGRRLVVYGHMWGIPMCSRHTCDSKLVREGARARARRTDPDAVPSAPSRTCVRSDGVTWPLAARLPATGHAEAACARGGRGVRRGVGSAWRRRLPAA